jgi:hypothetical protein
MLDQEQPDNIETHPGSLDPQSLDRTMRTAYLILGDGSITIYNRHPTGVEKQREGGRKRK